MSKFVEPEKVRLKARKRMNYQEAIEMMLNGFVMLVDCDRKMASYYLKMLNKKVKEVLGEEWFVEKFQALYEDKEYYAYVLKRLVFGQTRQT